MPAGSVQLEKPQKNRRITYIKMSEQWVTRQVDGVLTLDIVDETRRLDKVLLFDLEVGLVPEYIAGVLVVLLLPAVVFTFACFRRLAWLMAVAHSRMRGVRSLRSIMSLQPTMLDSTLLKS